ncbi:MAG: SIMPL domain-containing protein [Betaproteobacteria bacterium]|nr:SIMPL domain-containing protein [Betaproteobacteria bacterium]
MNSFGRYSLFLPALLISLGISIAGYFVGRTLYNANVGINVAEVKGLAERRVEADRAFWKIQYRVSGPGTTQVSTLYEKSESDQAQIVQLLVDSGFDKSEITPDVINYHKEEFRDNNKKLIEEKHVLSGSIDVETNKVRLVAGVRTKLNKLIAQGLDIQNKAPAYHFTKLNTIKPEMVKEATTNARIAATEFAADAGVKVGGIRNAQQGGFSIRDVGEEYGDTTSLEKDVRLVTTITFYLD